MNIALLLHVLAVVIWVGGMFFAHRMLRPVAASTEAGCGQPAGAAGSAETLGRGFWQIFSLGLGINYRHSGYGVLDHQPVWRIQGVASAYQCHDGLRHHHDDDFHARIFRTL